MVGNCLIKRLIETFEGCTWLMQFLKKVIATCGQKTFLGLHIFPSAHIFEFLSISKKNFFPLFQPKTTTNFA